MIYSFDWLTNQMHGYTRRCANVNGVQYLVSLASRVCEDSWIVHSSAVARVDSDESALGCSHSATVDSVAMFIDEQTRDSRWR